MSRCRHMPRQHPRKLLLTATVISCQYTRGSKKRAKEKQGNKKRKKERKKLGKRGMKLGSESWVYLCGVIHNLVPLANSVPILVGQSPRPPS